MKTLRKFEVAILKMYLEQNNWCVNENLNVVTEENSKESIDTDCPQNVSECSSKDANIILKVDPFKSNTKQHKGMFNKINL